jgi:hypothetical protein
MEAIMVVVVAEDPPHPINRDLDLLLPLSTNRST